MSGDDAIPANNGTVITVSQIIKAVMSLAAKAELGALFINCREAIPTRHALEIMGHKNLPHPTTDRQDYSTGGGHRQHSKQAPKIY
jgi:hypothetical protein